jgi:hypothetical protein
MTFCFVILLTNQNITNQTYNLLRYEEGTPFKESEMMKAIEKELINMEKEGKLSKHIEVYEGKFIEKREEVAKSAAG